MLVSVVKSISSFSSPNIYLNWRRQFYSGKEEGRWKAQCYDQPWGMQMRQNLIFNFLIHFFFHLIRLLLHLRLFVLLETDNFSRIFIISFFTTSHSLVCPFSLHFYFLSVSLTLCRLSRKAKAKKTKFSASCHKHRTMSHRM